MYCLVEIDVVDTSGMTNKTIGSELTKIGVIGAGAWGTALAMAANRAGSCTKLWSRNENVVNSIANKRVNKAYLPDIFIDPDIEVTSDLEELRQSDFIILAVPAQNLRTMAIALADRIDEDIPLVIACKGIECGSLALMHEVLETTLPQNPILILSGPNFASEVARGLPTATTIACRDETIANQFIYAIGGRLFRPYYTDDIISTQIGGAVKNVIAIACGMAIGHGFGENAKAALITRGLAEITRLAEAKGGRRENLMGLAGMGDLFLTCSSKQSRNFSFGMHLGKYDNQISSSEKYGLVEGVATAESVATLANKLNISMPLCCAVHTVLQGKISLKTAIEQLLDRPFVMDVEQTSL